MQNLVNHFDQFRKNIIGINQSFKTPYGLKKMIYADWVASGRLYSPIEKRISEEIGPMVGNTHSESTATGKAMTDAYHLAQKIVKRHVKGSLSVEGVLKGKLLRPKIDLSYSATGLADGRFETSEIKGAGNISFFDKGKSDILMSVSADGCLSQITSSTLEVVSTDKGD